MVAGSSWFRRRRQAEDTCTEQCSSMTEDAMVNTCLYDCYQAEGTELQSEVSGAGSVLYQYCTIVLLLVRLLQLRAE